MEVETVSPPAEQAEASEQRPAEQAVQETKPEEPAKREKTPEEREIARQRRRIDNLTRRLYEMQGQQSGNQHSTPAPAPAENAPAQEDDRVTLSRAELQKLIDKQARELAPTISKQESEKQHRAAVVEKLAQAWGSTKFDALAADLNDAFDGLTDRSGRPKPAADAIFEADDPQGLIEYLADPENAAEAEAVSKLNAIQAGRAIAKLEDKLAKKKAEAKPEASKAAEIVEPVKGSGSGEKDPSKMTDAEFAAWRKRQIAQRR